MENKMNSAVNDLITRLSSSDDLARTEACESLIAIGRPAVPLLVEVLKNPKYLARWEAAKALAEIGDPTAAPALVQALEDDVFEVRWRAAAGLMKMGINGLRPLLRALVEDAESVTLRESAHHILHGVGREELRNYLSPVLSALERTWAPVEVATRALQTIEGLEAFQRTHGGTDYAVTREPVSTITNPPTDIGARRRAWRYAKTLRYQVLCSDDLRPSQGSESDEGSVLCLAR